MLAGNVLDAYAADQGAGSDGDEKDVQSSLRPKVAKASQKPKAAQKQPLEPPRTTELPVSVDGSALTDDASGDEDLGPRRELRDLPAPTYEGLRTAGYLETKDAFRRIWSWAKEHGPDDMVWPTPTAQAQEALRFDACGWPHESTTPEEWLGMIQARQPQEHPRTLRHCALDLHPRCFLTVNASMRVRGSTGRC